MANGGKDIRLGDDKRPVTIIPKTEDNLYNVRNGAILTDEFGTPLTTEIDEIFVADATSKRSTSVVFPEKPEDSYQQAVDTSVGIYTGSYGHDLDVYTTTQVKKSDNSLVSFASTVALAAGGSASVPLELYPDVEVKTVNDQTLEYNRIYFDDAVGIKTNTTVRVGDRVSGSFFKSGTIVSRVNRSRIVLSKNIDNVGILTTNDITFTRSVKSNRKSINTWKVVEQFKETSEVSSSLLGIPRAETQLSLFSDVSVYGLDPDEFENFVYNGGYSFNTWESRANAIYGNRYRGRVQEEVQEAAIRLEVFSAPYSFPFGPPFEKLGVYNETQYNFYRNFINLGLELYNYYNVGGGSNYPAEWKNKFLDPALVYIDSNEVKYNDPIENAFAAIDVWTDTWRSLELKELIDPVTGSTYDFADIQFLASSGELSNVASDVDTTNTRPGYSSTHDRYTYLQSRRVFRYQPGRISGFTFGVKSSTEQRAGSIIEWGIKNPTDQYLFQIDTGNLKIIRRSTLPLEASVLARSGLTIEDQVKKVSGDPFDTTEYYTIEIIKDKFNGDILNGNGPSGYNLLPERVTMYKIEFGWYGAIGARFYAYVPIGNGECRWVVMHTFVIENSLRGPCLEDSYFRLFYSINIDNNKNLRTPQFLYKYGASYYIDGGDEGTSQVFTSSGISSVGIDTSRTLMGITPKNFLANQLGDLITNKKLIIPTELNITSDSLAKVEVVTCQACPGYGHVYTPGVASTIFGRYINAQFTGTNELTAIDPLNRFKPQDDNAKIIAPSIYNAYITDLSAPVGLGTTSESATIQGWGPGLDGYPLYSGTRFIGGELTLDRVTGINTTNPISSTVGVGTYPHTIRLSNYDGYMASDYRITGSEITLQFVNPDNLDDYQHYSDFLIGITDRPPNVTLPNTLDSFETVDGGSTTSLSKSQILYAEHSHTHAYIDENAVETGETFEGREHVRCETDYRIPFVENSTLGGGYCSIVQFTVEEPSEINEVESKLGSELGLSATDIANDSAYDANAEYFIKVSPWPANTDFGGGQVKVKGDNPSNVRYVGRTKKFTSAGIVYGYVKVDGDIGKNAPFTVEIRPITMRADRNPIRQKLFNFDPFPLFLVARLRDNAAINNITIKEKIGSLQKTIAPRLYVLGHHMSVTFANNKTSNDLKPTNFIEIDRQSSALVDIQNQQVLRPGVRKDIVYVGANTTKSIDMTPIFGQDRNVITPDNLNIEATFITAKKIDSGTSGTVEAALNFKEQ